MSNDTREQFEAHFKRTDRKLLADALHSNGGGVHMNFYPEAAVRRMLKQGLVQFKPNQHKSLHHALLITLTPAGTAAAREIDATMQGAPI